MKYTLNWVMYERKFCERNNRTNCVMKQIGIILQCHDFFLFFALPREAKRIKWLYFYNDISSSV